MFPITHKTLVVLDHGPHFAKSCKQPIEYDVLSKAKTPGMIPAAPITKTLWTCSVETILEYMRIVYDIFPAQNLIQAVFGSQSLNTWALKEQNTQQMMVSLAHAGPPGRDDTREEYSIMHGLTHAIEVLCEPTEQQSQERLARTDSGSKIENKGRIICLTAVKSEAQLRMLEECVCDALNQHNLLAASTDSLLPVSRCELVLIHITPVGDESKISDRPKKELSAVLHSEVHVTQSGRYLYNKMVLLVQQHYDLSSTTVTGIPMKEEQNASSSANYDVELLHPAAVHYELLNSVVEGSTDSTTKLKQIAGAQIEGLVIPSKEGLPTDTVTLKWCTPKSNVVELHNCTGAYRITPVDVNSRPSSCLTNFLLGGRAVMLEQPRKLGTKVISHMLASHGGEIFIHTIPTARSILEDPPSISEGCGGRVTDYRITDFGEFMKENRLAPATPAMVSENEEFRIRRAANHLERMTRYWPMVIGETIIFNMASHIDPLPALITKEHLDEDDMLECKKAIYYVVGMESRNEALPIASVGSRGKGPKRDEQYRQMWAELESLVRAHASTSETHQKVLDCLLECKKPVDDAKSSPKKGEKSSVKEEKMDVAEEDASWKDLDRFQKMTEREKQDMNKSDKTSESGSAPKRLKTESSEPIVKTGGGQNLLSLWTNRIKTAHSKRHSEFTGRSESEGNIAELYTHMKEENIDPSESTATSKPGSTPGMSTKPVTSVKPLITQTAKQPTPITKW